MTIKGNKCNKWFHMLFHVCDGHEEQSSIAHCVGARWTTDFSYARYRCVLCKKQWIKDYTEDERTYEKLQSETIK